MDWRFHVALVLANETGHRLGAVRQLRWSDIDFDGRTIRWRAEHEKTGYEHRTPVTAEAVAALESARRGNTQNGDAPVMPSPRSTSTCVTPSMVRTWWEKAEALAGLEPKRGRGWHSLRRKFASDLMHQPRSRSSANWEAGSRPRRCCGVISRPTRRNSGPSSRAAAESELDPDQREPNGGNPIRQSRNPNGIKQLGILLRKLGHRDWARPKRQAGELGREVQGRAGQAPPRLQAAEGGSVAQNANAAPLQFVHGGVCHGRGCRRAGSPAPS